MRAIIKSSILAALLLGLAVGSAAAAPQILGVIAAAEPTPLYCQGGMCSADLSAFCLQKSRPVPMSGMLYQIHGAERVAFVAVTEAGDRVPLSLDKAEVQVPRGLSAVRVSITEAQLAQVGGVRAEIQVGENVSAVPLRLPGDPEPLSAEEVAFVTGPLRTAAAGLFDTEQEMPRALRLTNKLVNANPPYGRMSQAWNRELWANTFGDVSTDDPAIARVAELYDRCLGRDSKFYFSLRRCLEARHDRLQMELNHTYWNSVGAGY